MMLLFFKNVQTEERILPWRVAMSGERRARTGMRGEDDESWEVMIRTEADIAEALAALTAADGRLSGIVEAAVSLAR